MCLIKGAIVGEKNFDVNNWFVAGEWLGYFPMAFVQ
jgi:hypothetical protein